MPQSFEAQSGESRPEKLTTTERRLFAWCLAAAALMCAALAAPLFAGRVYVADDLGEYHLPIRAFYSEQLKTGQSFDWFPALFSGFYLSGEGQAGTYHPLHLALYRFLPLSVAFDLELIVSYPLMLVGSYLLLRRWLARRDAALLGAFAFTFSGFNLLHFIHPNGVAVVAHWPWLLWAIDLALNRRGLSQFCAAKWDCPPLPGGSPIGAGATSTDPSAPHTVPWAFALISLVLGSEILIGYPQYVWMGFLVAVPYALLCLAKNPAQRRRPLALLCLAGVTGLLLGGIQLIPSIDALNHSTRQSADAAFVVTGSLHPLNLLQVVAPYLFATRVVGQNTHELGLYFGAVPLLLCAWLLAQRRSWGDRRPLIVAALTVAGLALLLAFGQYGIGGSWQQYLPLVGKFRFPCRSIVWVYAAVALLAAIAWQRLAEVQADGCRTSSVPLWLVCAASLAAALIAPWLWPEFVAKWPLMVVGPLCFAGAAIALDAATRGSRAALVALILFTLLDLGTYGLSYSILSETDRLDSFAQEQDTPPNADRPIVAQPISEIAAALPAGAQPQNPGPQVGNRLLLAGFRRADGYAGLIPAQRLDYRDLLALRVAGVGFRAEQLESGGSHPITWLPVPDPLPPVRLVTRAIVDRGGAFPPEAVAVDAALVDVPSTFLFIDVEAKLGAPDDAPSGSGPLGLLPGPPGTITDLRQRAGRFSLNTETPGRQLLVVATSFHSGWQATVDGRPTPVLPINRDFLGCVVEPGKHRVTLDFQPFSLQLGRVLSTLGLGLWCAQLVVAAWLGRRRVAPQTDATQKVALAPGD